MMFLGSFFYLFSDTFEQIALAYEILNIHIIKQKYSLYCAIVIVLK